MGFDYAHAGPTHYALEDIAVLRTLPGLTIVIPADSAQAATAVRKTAYTHGPVYYSLAKSHHPDLGNLGGSFELGRLQVVRTGGDLAIISMGSVSIEAAAAAEDLATHGIRASLAVVSSYNPDPAEDVARFLANFRSVICVEAQAVSGGLSAFVASVIAGHGLCCKLHALAARHAPDGTSGREEERWRKYGLDRENIVQIAAKALGASQG